MPIAVVLDPQTDDAWSVFSPVADGQSLTLVERDGSVFDQETGTMWDVASGIGLEGPLAGEVLSMLPSFTSFLSDARTFWPDASYWGE